MNRKQIKNMANISFRLCGSETNTNADADEQALTIDPYFPLFSSSLHDDPFLHQPEPTHFNIHSLDHQDDDAASDPESVILNFPDLSDRENQVSFVMDLFQQRVEQSQLLCQDVDEDDDVVCSHLVYDSLKDSDFGVIENSIYNLELDLGLGFGLDSQENSGLQNIDANYNDNDNDVVYNDSNVIIDDDDDDYFIERRVSGIESCEAESTVSIHANAIRVDGFGSDSDSENNQNSLAIDLNSGDEYGLDVTVGNGSFGDGADYDDDDDDVSVTIPLCWDSLQLEDHRENNEDFEWEEVDGRVEEREVLSMFIDDDEASVSLSISLSISPLIAAPEDLVNVERGGLDNLEWQVLLNANNLDHDHNSEPYLGGHDDYIYTAEYETLFGQFMENENAMMGRPPAAKSVVEKLPSMVLTKADVESNNAVCAVCKDDINVGERVKQLPCMHRYHGECIVPWLGIRNTCPVCRYELPTDDADYERRKVAERPASAGHRL